MGREVRRAVPLVHHSVCLPSAMAWASSLPPAGGLRSASSGPVPRSGSQAPAPVCVRYTPPGWLTRGLRLAVVCARLPWSSCVDRLLRSRPIAPDAPLLSPLTFLMVRVLPQAREHRLTFCSRPQAHVPSYCFSSSCSLRVSSHPVGQESFLSS